MTHCPQDHGRAIQRMPSSCARAEQSLPWRPSRSAPKEIVFPSPVSRFRSGCFFLCLLGTKSPVFRETHSGALKRAPQPRSPSRYSGSRHACSTHFTGHQLQPQFHRAAEEDEAGRLSRQTGNNKPEAEYSTRPLSFNDVGTDCNFSGFQ